MESDSGGYLYCNEFTIGLTKFSFREVILFLIYTHIYISKRITLTVSTIDWVDSEISVATSEILLVFF